MTRRLGSGSLVIATHNAGKLKEISALLEPHGMKCLSAGSLGLPEPAETGTTFVQNALLKARAAAEASGIVALADDSGLSVAALGGCILLYTAFYFRVLSHMAGERHFSIVLSAIFAIC